MLRSSSSSKFERPPQTCSMTLLKQGNWNEGSSGVIATPNLSSPLASLLTCSLLCFQPNHSAFVLPIVVKVFSLLLFGCASVLVLLSSAAGVCKNEVVQILCLSPIKSLKVWFELKSRDCHSNVFTCFYSIDTLCGNTKGNTGVCYRRFSGLPTISAGSLWPRLL